MSTRDTVTERVARLTREREEREERGAAAFSDDYRRTHGFGRPTGGRRRRDEDDERATRGVRG